MPRMLSFASAFIGASIYAIGAQVGLEFLGLGDISTVTWGTNLYWASNDLALLTESWWTFVPTGLSIAIVSFALTLINFGIDEVSNPRLISERLWRNKIPKDLISHGITLHRIIMSDTLISVKNLSVNYITDTIPIRAVRDVSFEISSGENIWTCWRV